MPREEVCKQCGIAIAADGYFVCDDCRAEHTQQKSKSTDLKAPSPSVAEKVGVK